MSHPLPLSDMIIDPHHNTATVLFHFYPHAEVLRRSVTHFLLDLIKLLSKTDPNRYLWDNPCPFWTLHFLPPTTYSVRCLSLPFVYSPFTSFQYTFLDRRIFPSTFWYLHWGLGWLTMSLRGCEYFTLLGQPSYVIQLRPAPSLSSVHLAAFPIHISL